MNNCSKIWGSMLFLGSVLLITSPTYAQKLKDVRLGVLNETTAYPFTRYLPIHPGGIIGVNVWNKEGEKVVHEINAYIGGYHHRKLENGFFINGEYALRFPVFNTISIDFPIGLGYQHSFYPGTVYEQDNTTGSWEAKRQWGKPHGLVKFGLGFAYLKAEKVHPFIRQESVIDIPFFNGFLNTRTLVIVGVYFKLKGHE